VAARRDDDKEPIRGSDHDDAVVEVGRRDNELVGFPPVYVGDSRHHVSAAWPRAFTAKIRDETSAVAVPGTPRLAQRE
jgi:hypothetical protein